MTYTLSTDSMDFVALAFQQKFKFIFVSDISSRSNNGIEFCAGLFYADYLGIPLKGSIDRWVRTMRDHPLSANPQALDGVRRLLSLKSVHLTDDGQLVSTSQFLTKL